MGSMNTVILRVSGVALAAVIAARGLAIPYTALAQSTAPSPAAMARALPLHGWRRSLVETPLPGRGCFIASYPDKKWHQTQCVTARPRPPTPPPANRGLPLHTAAMDVGNGNDFSAQVASGTSISRGEGAFIQVLNVTSEDDGGVADEFTLQLNANEFATPACNNVNGCLGWAQFIYANPYQTTSGPASYGAAFMQYWLLNYGSSCPPGWNSAEPVQASCWRNSSIVEVPLQAIGSLRSMTLTGTPGSGGNDTVAFYVDGILYSASNGAADPTSDLAGNWNTAEFNIFGDGGLSEATFNTGSSLALITSVNNGSSTSPSCIQSGTTGETNNLALASPCCPYAGTAGGTTPGIAFLESSTTPAPTANCSVLTHSSVWSSAAVDHLLLQ